MFATWFKLSGSWRLRVEGVEVREQPDEACHEGSASDEEHDHHDDDLGEDGEDALGLLHGADLGVGALENDDAALLGDAVDRLAAVVEEGDERMARAHGLHGVRRGGGEEGISGLLSVENHSGGVGGGGGTEHSDEVVVM